MTDELTDPLVDGPVSLREVLRSDLEMLRRWRNDWSVRQATREYRLLTEADQEAWYAGLSRKPPTDIMFVIVLDVPHTTIGGDKSVELRSIGVCGLTGIDWKNRTAEVSVYIADSDARSKGLGSRAVKCLMAYGFLELGLHKLWAEVYDFNEASNKMFDKLGFRQEAFLPEQVWRAGDWHGSYIYSVIWPKYGRTDQPREGDP